MLPLPSRMPALFNTTMQLKSRCILLAIAAIGLPALVAVGEDRPAADELNRQETVAPQAAASSEMKLPALRPIVAPAAEAAGRYSILVLTDWRVIGGQVDEIADGYRLTRRDGFSETIPTFLVRVAADSLESAYEKLRDNVRNPRPDDHITLAEWCLQQKLHDYAAIELAAALKLDPNRRDAREMLKKLDEHLNVRPIHQASADAPVRTADGFLAATPKSTAGLARETMRTYVSRVQPLLLNKCGNVSCHGNRAGREFALQPVRSGAITGRTSTFDNLDATLARLDPQAPDQSPLLAALADETHRSVFRGRGGAIQEQELRDWLAQAGKDLAPRQAEAPATIIQAAAMSFESKATAPLQKVDAPPVLKKVLEDDRQLTTILSEERPDPFDPEAFNREMHAAKAMP